THLLFSRYPIGNNRRLPRTALRGHGKRSASERKRLVGQLTSIDKWRETALLEVQATFWLPAKEFHHDQVQGFLAQRAASGRGTVGQRRQDRGAQAHPCPHPFACRYRRRGKNR